MRTVFLDLDGTLTDPKPGITRSIRYALTELGLEAPAEDELTWCIGPPLLTSFETLTGDAGLAERALALYRERYTDIGLFENRVYEEVPGMLGSLKRAECRLWVATSKPHIYARRITAHFGLDDWLDGLFGSELDGTRTGKADLLTHALEETGAAAGESAMLGDRKHDMIGAARTGLFGVGAIWGYGGREELSLAGAKALAATPAEAADYLLGPSPTPGDGGKN